VYDTLSTDEIAYVPYQAIPVEVAFIKKLFRVW